MSNFFLIGKILKPHGIQGELRVEIISDFPERFLALKRVYLSPPNGGDFLEMSVTRARLHKQYALVSFQNVHDRDAAEEYREYELFVPEEERWVKDEDFYYFHELENLPVYLPGGDHVGVVEGMSNQPTCILEIRDKEGREILVPFNREFVKVLRDEGKIILHPIPGLLSLNREDPSKKNPVDDNGKKRGT